MQFSNPAFLYALFALLIPIIIHLFNFRRYKKVYFSNVQLLEDIQKKTKRESQLKHYLVMALRMLAIAGLVLAFAQPFIPHNREKQSGNFTTVIFVDNSYSMTVNTQSSNLLQDEIEVAKDIVKAYSYTDDFILVTQNFSSKESRIMSKDEMLSLLDEVEVSQRSRSWEDITAFMNHLAKTVKKGDVHYYYLSDFQKNNGLDAFDQGKEKYPTFLVRMESDRVENITLDSCWFQAPVFKSGQQVTLHVIVKNYGEQDIEKLPLRLYVNDEQKSLVSVDLKAGSGAEYQMKYTITQEGFQRGKLQIEDAPITFDDQLFFTYQVMPATHIIVIHDGIPNKYLNALYGKDSLFIYDQMSADKINYSQFANSQLIVLNEVTNISSGMQSELKKYVNNGGSLVVFPAEKLDVNSWKTFLSSLGVAQYGEEISGEMTVEKINTESIYYKGALEQTNDRLDMPKVLKYFVLQGGNPGEAILQLGNHAPLLAAYHAGNGTVFLSAVALDDKFGDTHKHTLFFIPMHNIGIMSQMDRTLYQIMGKEETRTENGIVSMGDVPLILKSLDNQVEVIPEQRVVGNNTLLFFHDQVEEPGFFDLMSGNQTVDVLAFNMNRHESHLDYYSEKELKEFSSNHHEAYLVLDGSQNQSQAIADRLSGKPLWMYFVIFALVALLGEVLILRLWRV